MMGVGWKCVLCLLIVWGSVGWEGVASDEGQWGSSRGELRSREQPVVLGGGGKLKSEELGKNTTNRSNGNLTVRFKGGETSFDEEKTVTAEEEEGLADWKGVVIGGAGLIGLTALIMGGVLFARKKRSGGSQYKVTDMESKELQPNFWRFLARKRRGEESKKTGSSKGEEAWDWRGPPSVLEDVPIPSSSGHSSLDENPDDSLATDRDEHKTDDDESRMDPSSRISGPRTENSLSLQDPTQDGTDQLEGGEGFWNADDTQSERDLPPRTYSYPPRTTGANPSSFPSYRN